MKNKEKITPSKNLFFFCLSFIIGIFFAPISFLIGLFFIFFLFYFLSKNHLVVIFCTFFFVVGFYYFHFNLYNIPSEVEDSFSGKVVESPVTKDETQRVIVENSDYKVLFYTHLYPRYEYGDQLTVKGDFSVPENKDYANYLKKEGIYFVSFYPEAEKTGEEAFFIASFLSNQKEKARINIKKSLPAPEKFFLEAVILGERESFTEDFNNKISITGTRHITAISGMHISIISGVIFFFFLFLGFRKGWATLLAISFVFIFIVFVGAPASAIRAGVMGGLVLFALSSGRKAKPFRILAFTGAVMLAFNPLLLHYDLGFQLSFLAVIGIISLYYPIKKKVTSWFSFFKKHEKIADVLAVTTGAQIFVFPLIVYNFGHLSVFSIFANVIIVPLLPFIIILGLLTALTGWIIFSIPVFVLLSFVVFVIDFFYNLPFSALHINGAPLFLVFVFYFYLFYLMNQKKVFN
jgi:competence protein ComEC